MVRSLAGALLTLRCLFLPALQSGTSLDSQIRYAKGTLDILEAWDKKEAQVPANVIVEGGEYVSKAYGQHGAKQ